MKTSLALWLFPMLALAQNFLKVETDSSKLTLTHQRVPLTISPLSEIKTGSQLVVSISSLGLKLSDCLLIFKNNASVEVLVELDYAMTDCADNAVIDITFTSSCGQRQLFKMNRDFNRRFKCASFGDPHIMPFDSVKYWHFQGTGIFSMVHSIPTEIQTELAPCGTGVTCNKRFAIRHLDTLLILTAVNSQVVIQEVVKGKAVSVSTNKNSKIILLSDGSAITVTAVSWIMNIDIDLIASYYTRVSGLCGDFNNQSALEDYMVANPVVGEGFRIRDNNQNLFLGQNSFKKGSVPISQPLLTCSQTCASTETNPLKKRQNALGDIRAPLMNTGNCNTSLPDSMIIKTGDASVDQNLIERIDVKSAKQNCIMDAAVETDKRAVVQRYLSSLQSAASVEVKLLDAAKLSRNKMVIANLKRIFRLY